MTMKTNGWHILIVEDEPQMASIIADYLAQAGMSSQILTDGTDAVETILEISPDLVVLDVMLPGKDGLSICREVRALSEVPVILETARVEELDRLLGLELGADDYLCKPYSPRELVARVKSILRRQERLLHHATKYEDTSKATNSSLLVLDEERWSARLRDTELPLTRREFQLLLALSKRPGRVFSRSQLVELAFADDADVFDRVIDTHVKNIRTKIRKIDPAIDIIRSVYGVGYSYEENEDQGDC